MLFFPYRGWSNTSILLSAGIYILAIPPPPGGDFCPNWKTGKNFKDLKKGKEKEGKEENKKKSD